MTIQGWPSSYKDTSVTGLGAPRAALHDLINLTNYVCNDDLISKLCHILKDWRLGLEHVFF